MTGHLIHIGFAKTGTTFLQQWFAAHPQLSFVVGGIAGFRNVYEISRAGLEPRAGVRFRVTSDESLTAPYREYGAAMIDYERDADVSMQTLQARACDTLAALFPAATILVVTRGFRSMIVSSYSEYVRSGGDVALDDLIDAALGRREGLDALLSREPWHYDSVIGMYRAAFGEGKVIALPYELLRDDAGAFTRDLEARLGLHHHAASRERVRPALSAEEMSWYPRITKSMRRVLPQSLFAKYVNAVMKNRLRVPIRALQRIRPAKGVTADVVPQALLNALRGRAQSLLADPVYAPYIADYLG